MFKLIRLISDIIKWANDKNSHHFKDILIVLAICVYFALMVWWFW